MVDDESISQGYHLLAESRRSILVFRLPCIATKAYPWFFYADLNLCGPRRIICSLTEGYQEYPHVPSKPRASLPNSLEPSFYSDGIRSFPCYTKNYYLVLLTKVYHLVSRIVIFLTKVYNLVPFPVNLDGLSVISQFKPT